MLQQVRVFKKGYMYVSYIAKIEFLLGIFTWCASVWRVVLVEVHCVRGFGQG